MITTKAQFKLFKKECQKWIDRFELNNWSCVYEFKKLINNDAQSLVSGDVYNATIALDKDIETDFDRNMTDNEYIKEIAKHEIIHLLLGRFGYNAHERFITKSEIIEAEEELVRKLLKIIK